MSDPKSPSKIDAKSEEEWEEEILDEALEDVITSDGRIDFDKLRATGLSMTLDELCPEGDEDDES